MYMSTLARLMPSIILSKAAKTAVDGPVSEAPRPPFDWEVAPESEDLVAVWGGVGEGFDVAVRPRVEPLEELLF
jgi:hypothetical protein